MCWIFKIKCACISKVNQVWNDFNLIRVGSTSKYSIMTADFILNFFKHYITQGSGLKPSADY